MDSAKCVYFTQILTAPLVVSVNKAGLERSVERIVSLRNNLTDPFAISLRRAWCGFTARLQRSVQIGQHLFRVSSSATRIVSDAVS